MHLVVVGGHGVVVDIVVVVVFLVFFVLIVVVVVVLGLVVVAPFFVVDYVVDVQVVGDAVVVVAYCAFLGAVVVVVVVVSFYVLVSPNILTFSAFVLAVCSLFLRLIWISGWWSESPLFYKSKNLFWIWLFSFWIVFKLSDVSNILLTKFDSTATVSED